VGAARRAVIRGAAPRSSRQECAGGVRRPTTLLIRDAAPADAPVLGDIAAAAKAHWGYPDAWMAAWRASLAIAPADLAHWRVRIATGDDVAPIGFVATSDSLPRWAVEHLWVHPTVMGRGIGRRLLLDALHAAHAAGALGLTIDADPHASDFYRRCGARVVSALPAPMPGAPDRTLPRLWLDADVAPPGRPR